MKKLSILFIYALCGLLTSCVSETKGADYQYSHSKPYDGFSGVKAIDGGNNRVGKTSPSTR